MRLAQLMPLSAVSRVWLLAMLWASVPGAAQFRQIVSSPLPDGAPCWSPDGQTVAFSSLLSGEWEIYTVGAWGGEPANFSQNPGATDIYAHWSPQGDRIVFTSTRNNGSGDGDMDLWIQSLDGSLLACVTDHPGYDNFAAFDPGGSRLAFSSDRDGETEIWVMPIDHPEKAYRAATGPVECFHAGWSPDGQWLVFDGREANDPLSARRLYRVPAAGGVAQEIPIGMLVGDDPSWSPDGRYLAFAGGDDPVDWDLWVWDFQEEALIQLTRTRFPDQSPLWNASGSEIVYAAVIEGNKDVWVVYDLPFTAARPESFSRVKGSFRP
jgi:Tol biopolymer transport system component